MPNKYPNAGWVHGEKPKYGVTSPDATYGLVPDVTKFPLAKRLHGPKPLQSEVEYYCYGRKASTYCNPSMSFRK